MKTKNVEESHRCHLSTAGGAWTVIYEGGPLCRSGSEADARATLARFASQTRYVDVKHGRVWDGDIGALRDDKVLP